MCVLQASARVRRDAPAAASPLAELEKHATEFQKTFSEQFNTFTSSKNTQEFNKALKEGSDSVLQQLSALSSSLQTVVRILSLYFMFVGFVQLHKKVFTCCKILEIIFTCCTRFYS